MKSILIYVTAWGAYITLLLYDFRLIGVLGVALALLSHWDGFKEGWKARSGR